MDYEFFLSYTRAKNDEFLKRFFDDLSQEIRDARGLVRSAEVGFLDQQQIELGSQWEETIEAALRAAKAMVCIYSPGYFRSEYCGREWRAFYDRCDQSVQLGTYGSLPPLIKPVPWITPIPGNLPSLVAGLQYGKGDPASVMNREGLKYVMKQMGTYQKEYEDYIHGLAREIVQTADGYPLPFLPGGLPPLGQIVPPFPIAQSTAAALGPTPRPDPKYVRFFVAASDPRTFHGKRSPEPYLDSGGGEWKPFFHKDPDEIGPLVQHIVSDRDLHLSSNVYVFDASLKEAVKKARDELQQIVIVLVDGWTVFDTAEARDILHDFDEENYYNCSVLVLWDEDDPELAELREDIEQTLQETFCFRVEAKNSMFYRDAIRSKDELDTVLHEVIVQLQAQIRKRATPVKKVPLGIAQPVISGPSV